MVKGPLALGSLLLWCFAVGCSGDRQHHSGTAKDGRVERERPDHIDQNHYRKPVEVYLKLSDHPQLFVAKKSEEGFLFTTALPSGASDGKTCEQCVFRVVCKGPDCAEVCELCGKRPGTKLERDSSACDASREVEQVSRVPKTRAQKTTVKTSTTRQQETVTSTSKPRRFSDENDSSATKSDERVGPVRKRINARRKFRRKQLEERNKARLEARKLNSAKKRTETEPKNEKPTTSHPKTTKHPEEKGEKVKVTTKSAISSKDSNERSQSLEHWKDKSHETHENDVVFHIPKKKEPIIFEQHEEPTKFEKRIKVSEEEQSENSKILKLLEKIVKQKEMEEQKHVQEIDKNKDAKHKMEKVETTTKRQKLTELDSKDTKPIKSNDAKHPHAVKVEDKNAKEADRTESDWDSMDEENFVKAEKKEEPNSWPELVGKLLQTEIESAHALIKHKPLKSALKNIKERFKPIFIAASKALANVFGVYAVDEEQTIKVKKEKDKDGELKSSQTTLAPSPITTITTKPASADDTHLSKPTAVKMDTHHRRRAFIDSTHRKERQRRPKPLSLRASARKKLRELEAKSGSVEDGNDCSCKC